MTLWTHKQDGGLYVGDDHIHQDLLEERRRPEEETKQDHAMDERGFGKDATAQKAQPSPEGVGGGPEETRDAAPKVVSPQDLAGTSLGSD